jgi:hypothetical protein
MRFRKPSSPGILYSPTLTLRIHYGKPDAMIPKSKQKRRRPSTVSALSFPVLLLSLFFSSSVMAQGLPSLCVELLIQGVSSQISTVRSEREERSFKARLERQYPRLYRYLNPKEQKEGHFPTYVTKMQFQKILREANYTSDKRVLETLIETVQLVSERHPNTFHRVLEEEVLPPLVDFLSFSLHTQRELPPSESLIAAFQYFRSEPVILRNFENASLEEKTFIALGIQNRLRLISQKRNQHLWPERDFKEEADLIFLVESDYLEAIRDFNEELSLSMAKIILEITANQAHSAR